MKHIFLLLTMALSLSLSSAQNFEDMKTIQLKDKADYEKAEPLVKEAAEYLLNYPIDENVENRKIAIQLVMKWMEGTPDYTFEIGQKAMNITKDNPEMLSLYFAAMGKAVLSYPLERLSNEKVYKMAVKYLAEYCSNKKNELKPTKALKNAIKELN